jgi:hypothetical protein
MIVVVILGILVAIAIPVYNGVQERARKAVGEANAEMLNRGARQLEWLGYTAGGDPEGAITYYEPPAKYDHEDADQFASLMKLLGYEPKGDLVDEVTVITGLKYVKWGEENAYEYDNTAVNGLVVPAGGGTE